MNEKQKQEYIQYIHTKFCAQNIRDIARNICNIIEANILNESIQDYDPVGASTMTLMSDIKGGGWDETTHSTPNAAVKMHLDKSHITTHTYPDASDPEGICTFRLDIDVATCGEIIPLRALNYMFEVFECDVVYIDYVVRGYTRLANGKKIYNDQYFNSIQDFIPKETLEKFHYRQDLNIQNDNIWQTKLMVKPTDPLNYLLDPADKNHADIKHKMELLEREMKDVFHLN
jgi:S-adenosylmethionine decarboxylase